VIAGSVSVLSSSSFSAPVDVSSESSLLVSGPVSFGNGLTVGGTLDIRSGAQVIIKGPIALLSSGKIQISDQTQLRITNCNTPTTLAGNVEFTVPSPSTQPSYNITIESTCALTIPPSSLTAAGVVASCASNFSTTPSTIPQGLTITYTGCAIFAPPSPPAMDLTWLWIVIAVVVLLLVGVLFLVPYTRKKILGICIEDDFDDSSGDDVPKTKPKPAPGRGTSEGSRGGKVIPNPPFNVTAIADYMAVDTSQISVTKGVIYTVQRVDEGQHWFQAKGANGKLGWFPASYARIEN